MGRLLPFALALAFAGHAQATEPSVHLLNIGQSPHAPLQISAADVVRSLALVVKTRVSMRVGTMTVPTAELPTLVLSLAWRVTGDTTELAIEAVEVRDGEGANPIIVDELRAATGALVGEVLRSGAPISGASPVVAQTLAELQAVLAHLLVPMPFEPVGVNAQWEVIRTVERRGVTAVERSVYELVERDGQTIRVKLVIDVGANPQNVDDPLAAGARLTELDGSGAGEILVRLDQPGPVEGSLGLTSIFELTDRERPLVLRTETTVELSTP